MTVGEIVEQVCEDLYATEQCDTPLNYRAWSTSKNGDGRMIVETPDGSYGIELQVTKLGEAEGVES